MSQPRPHILTVEIRAESLAALQRCFDSLNASVQAGHKLDESYWVDAYARMERHVLDESITDN